MNPGPLAPQAKNINELQVFFTKTKDLAEGDLDSTWTPVANLHAFGLHLDSRLRLAIHVLFAHARGRGPLQSFFVVRRILFSLYRGYHSTQRCGSHASTWITCQLFTVWGVACEIRGPPGWVAERQRVAPGNPATTIEAPLIRSLLIMPRTGQPVKVLAIPVP